MLEWWATNGENVITIGGFLLGVLGLFGIYFSYKGWKRKKPIYLICSNNIFSGLEHTIPDVEVKFTGYGQPIKALTVTKIAFWNAGTETLKKQDVVKAAPITIQGSEGVVFLSASVIESVSPLNKINCKVNQDRSRVTVTFDYLDHNQGANFQVFHTGTSNEDITLRGTIMGASSIRRKFRSSSTKPPPPIWAGLLPLSILWALWGMIALGIIYIDSEPAQPVLREPLTVETAGVGLLLFTVGFGSVLYLAHIPKPFSKILRH